MDLVSILRGIIGIIFIIGVAYLFSNNKNKINWSLVSKAFLIQLVFAVFIIHSDTLRSWFFPFGWVKDIIDGIGSGVVALLRYTMVGAEFVFGNLAKNSGPDSLGFYFAFQVLPTIIFVSTLTSVLYYLGILQAIVKLMAKLMVKVLGTSGAESLSNTANIFVGQSEAPLLVRPYIGTMTRSEILTIMVGGMATIAGGVMASYIQMLGQSFADVHNIPLAEGQLKFAVQLLAASTMAAPAGLAIAKILYPEVEEPKTKGTVQLEIEKNASNVIEAAATGASDGLQLALNVAGMLLAFIALIALINGILSWTGDISGINTYLQSTYKQTLSMQFIFGTVLQFVGIAIGIPLNDAYSFGSLIGTKIALNEFVAYLDLASMLKSGSLSEKTILMSTYALCGFANFSSIAIQIGGISPMAPHRKKDIASLGLKAVLGGTLATLMTATIAGILVG